MFSLPPITLRLRGWKLIDRVALAFLLLCSVALGAACGLLFVYESDLPEIRALETYRPNVVTEIYADDGQLVGSFALQRRILMTWEQVPKILYNAVTAIEDQHFEDHWGVDFPRVAGAAQFYFGKNVTDLNLQQAALLAGMIRGPIYSPLTDPARTLARRNLVIHQMMEEGKITPAEEEAAKKTRLGLHVQYPRNDLAPYFFEDIRKYLESTYGTEAVHERGLRVYTTLNIHMQKAANQSIRDGLHLYDRRHGW